MLVLPLTMVRLVKLDTWSPAWTLIIPITPLVGEVMVQKAQVHAGTVDRHFGLCHRGLCLLIRVLGVVQYVAAHDTFVVQVLAALVLQQGATLRCFGSQQVGFGCLQVELGVAVVDAEEHVALLHLLTLHDAYVHELAANLGNDGHVGRTAQRGAVAEGYGDIGLADGERLVGGLFYLGYFRSASRHQQRDANGKNMLLHVVFD